MHILLGAAAVFALVFSPQSSATDAAPTAGQLRAWRDFAATSGGSFEIRWGDSGAPRDIRRATKDRPASGPPLTKESAEELARRFFDANAGLFDLRGDLDDFAVAGAERAGGRWQVWVEQTYAGAPVEGGRYRVRFARDGSFESLDGSWVRDVGREHWISPEEAEHRALEALPPNEWAEVKTELDREKVGRRRRLVYCTRVKSAGWATMSGQAWVDPRTGVVLGHQVVKPNIYSDPR